MPISTTLKLLELKNIPNWNFERVVFPGQRLLFESVLEAQLQIYTCMSGDEIILNIINCNYLLCE